MGKLACGSTRRAKWYFALQTARPTATRPCDTGMTAADLQQHLTTWNWRCDAGCANAMTTPSFAECAAHSSPLSASRASVCLETIRSLQVGALQNPIQVDEVFRICAPRDCQHFVGADVLQTVQPDVADFARGAKVNRHILD